MIEIKQVKGYTIKYDTEGKLFYLYNPDGEQEATSDNQGRLEKKIEALLKQEFKRIPIIEVFESGDVVKGVVTSFNRADKEMWVSMEKSSRTWGSGRRKIYLGYSQGTDFYEESEANREIAERIRAKNKEIARVRNEIAELRDTLEKQINFAYFAEEESG